jgi:beta-lactamase class A
VIDAPPLPPPAIEQPAPRQVSYGVVSGRAAPGARRVLVYSGGRELGARSLREGSTHGRRFWLRVVLPPGDVSVRVTTIARDGRSSSRVVRDVFALPAPAQPRVVRAREDPVLAAKLGPLVRRFPGTGAYYVQSLTSGGGAAWNARARFPAGSTLKLAIAVTALVRHAGIPARGSYVGGLFDEMITVSDDKAANALEVWMAGSTSAGSDRVNAMMRSIGLVDSIMYGGYETDEARAPSGLIPVRVDEQPAWGIGKYTTAWDMTRLWRAVWLASGGIGPLRAKQPGFTPADARYLLWLLAHVRDSRKLDTSLRGRAGVSVLHKAGWISRARHDTGLVFWPGGVFVAGVMTWNGAGAGTASDRLAGRVASISLARFRTLRR